GKALHGALCLLSSAHGRCAMTILRRTLFTVGSLAGLLTCGCAREDAPATTESRPVIGLSVLTLTNPFFKEIADSLESEAKQHGYDVIGVSREFDPAPHHNQAQD